MNDKRTIEETLPMSESAYEAWNSGDLRDLPEAPEPSVVQCFNCERAVPVTSTFCSDACRDEYDGCVEQA